MAHEARGGLYFTILVYRVKDDLDICDAGLRSKHYKKILLEQVIIHQTSPI